MYQGKYAPKHRRRGRRMSSAALIALILTMFSIGGTVAFLITKSAPIQNTFTPVKTEIEIKEDFDKEKKENVKVVNKSEYPVYVRATYVANWVSDTDDSTLAQIPELKGRGVNSNSWTYKDGYYYYNQIVQADEVTENFINEFHADPKEGYHLEILVVAESVQAYPEQAVKDVWGFTPTVSSGT